MAVHSMFEVPIIHYEIANWELNKKKILDALPEETEDQCNPDDHGLYTDFFANAGRDVKELPPYGQTIISVIKPYIADFSSERRVEFTDMWYQKYYKGVQHQVHTHGHSGLSLIHI